MTIGLKERLDSERKHDAWKIKCYKSANKIGTYEAACENIR